MKLQLDYNFFRNICLAVANEIHEYQPDELVYICNSGMYATHAISSKTQIPIGYFNFNPLELNINIKSHKVVFIDDQITHSKINGIRNFMANNCQDVEWRVASIVIDGTIDRVTASELLTYGIKTKFVVEMPY